MSEPLWKRRPHFRMPSAEGPVPFGGDRLPGCVQRAIDNGDTEDPMWYAGPFWPSVQDILDMTDDEAGRFLKARGESATLRRSQVVREDTA